MLKVLNKALNSRTVWTLVFMIVLDIVSVYGNLLSPDLLVLINTILATLAGYFKLNPSQKY